MDLSNGDSGSIEKFCKTFFEADEPFSVVNDDMQSFLMLYCFGASYPNVETLTKLGKLSKCDINNKDSSNMSILLGFVGREKRNLDVRVLKKLIEMGADVNQKMAVSYYDYSTGK